MTQVSRPESRGQAKPFFASVAEIKAYNAGVTAVLVVAKRSAEAIASTTSRNVHEGFAVAALAELVEGGKDLFLPVPGDPPPEDRTP